jgi:hypothetical protein
MHDDWRASMESHVFANQKGGVGKTTVTLGIAAELAVRRVRVLLIDLDPQASATKVLGIDIDGRSSVADAMLEPERFRVGDAIVETDWGFDLAPAETALASRESRRATADEFVLRRQLGSCSASSANCAGARNVREAVHRRRGPMRRRRSAKRQRLPASMTQTCSLGRRTDVHGLPHSRTATAAAARAAGA